MPYGWESERLRLVPLDKQRHFENALRWLNDPEATAWTLIGDLPIGRLAEEAYFEACAKRDVFHDSEVVFAIELLDGTHIGLSSLNEIQWRHGVGSSGTLIGPVEYRGRGYGSEAVRARTRYAFDVLGLRLLLSHAMADNVASCKALMKAGYRETGRIPGRYWKRGAYRDVVLFALQREAWRP